jgi:Cof subfamily protein (haloacid dehalogenase superfamily)
MTHNIKMVLTDLDGTLLDEEHGVCARDMETLHDLGKLGVVRVAATGRTFYKVHKILNSDFPLDYVIFSSGAGVINWKTKEIILNHSLSAEIVASVSNVLMQEKLSFMLLHPIPENHLYVYHLSEKNYGDFHLRNQLYQNYASPLRIEPLAFGPASQFLIIFESHDISGFNALSAKLPQTKVIRATSPLDGKSIWMELFATQVSKGETAAWLCNRLNIKPEETMAIGNDYNDIDLLKFAGHSFVVANSPDELKAKYKITVSYREGGFTQAWQETRCKIKNP